MTQQIYLDNAASTPCDPRVVEDILPYFAFQYGNPSNTTHEFGRKALQAIEIARQQVSDFLSCLPQQLIWTSGATESNNLAIQGAVALNIKLFPNQKLHIITSSIEHKAVLETCEFLQSDQIEVSFIKPNTDGTTPIDILSASIKENTFLISIMLANNELGIINDLESICNICQNLGILLHSDATQYVGKLPLNLEKFRVDFLSISGHKMYAPKGVGALYVRNPSFLKPITYGGGHEYGLRSGTLNVPGIVGLGKACQILCDEHKIDYIHTKSLRDKIESYLKQLNPSVIINGENALRLPNISNITFPVKEGYSIMQRINLVACSSGAACDTSDNKPSHVMLNIGRSNHQAKNSLRLSVGRFTKEKDVIIAVEHIAKVLKKIEM